MTTFKIICPECGKSVVTACPEAMIWELCPGCRHHIWDRYDYWMAEACGAAEQHVSHSVRSWADN